MGEEKDTTLRVTFHVDNRPEIEKHPPVISVAVDYGNRKITASSGEISDDLDFMAVVDAVAGAFLTVKDTAEE